MHAISDFAPRLIAWQRQYGRHDLPWQRTQDPYSVWLSEIMLQQTQVTSVIAYYSRFITRFPDLATLAEASLDEVLALWSGLGYYARARHLHRCAQLLMTQYQGRFPREMQRLMALPGIGRSTAAAIAAFAFGARAAILDGNVKRILARLFGIEGFSGDKSVENTLWALAESLLPQKRGRQHIRAYTQGMMDLGATRCVRGRPACGACPFQHDCYAHITGREHELPVARPKKARPLRQTRMLILRHHHTVLLEKRAPTGIWGGLWSLPEVSDETALTALALHFGVVSVEALTPLAPVTHQFTHFQLMIAPWFASLATIKPSKARCVENEDMPDTHYIWAPIADLTTYGLPAPVRRLLETALSIEPGKNA
jgi:A/G-specific adenine glycosylase